MIYKPNPFSSLKNRKTLEQELIEAGVIDLAKDMGLPISSIPIDNAFNSIITADVDTIQAKQKAYKLSGFTNINVLIIGETGTGKELIARIIHGNSKGRFVGVNTAGIPDGILESEFFGSVAGAFTGAINRTGLIEEAQNGTLFLDEIGDMPMLLQAKLLRALQEREIRPIGSNKYIKFNCRIVAATNRESYTLCSGKHGFRSDLYYRLAGSIINLKPLKERGNDWLLILKSFGLDDLENKNKELYLWLQQSKWDGNIRELINWIVEYKALNS